LSFKKRVWNTFKERLSCFPLTAVFRKADAKVEKDFIQTKHFRNEFNKKNHFFSSIEVMV